MSFANFDASRAPVRAESQQQKRSTITNNSAASTSSMPKGGGAVVSATTSTTTTTMKSSHVQINQISDAIVQYSTNVDLLHMLSSQPTTQETELQYNVQVDVTEQLQTRVQKHLQNLASSLTATTGNGQQLLPRTETARIRTTMVKLEKDFKKIEQKAKKAKEEFNRKKEAKILGTTEGGRIMGEAREEEPIDLSNIKFEQVQAQDHFQESIIKERDVEIRKINKEMATVNEIFKDLAGIVNEQQDEIDNIETLMENSHAHAKAGLEQVQQANE
eukprot:CAMPEP_0118658128 /NCGR_PEP_ID=MMETSP0785-20121206/14396_1 /TAXON_ID=91992 /ORGANISM="Bolidomonas pacifica, Strain CCMP 1866" /LENGTH=273 /DNA_ID=CAMNT_0006551111 /DNA_START=106 /DNA_END=924 /DNA_ORIENTATION=-